MINETIHASRHFWIISARSMGKNAFATYLTHYGRVKVIAVQFCECDKTDRFDELVAFTAGYYPSPMLLTGLPSSRIGCRRTSWPTSIGIFEITISENTIAYDFLNM